MKRLRAVQALLPVETTKASRCTDSSGIVYVKQFNLKESEERDIKSSRRTFLESGMKIWFRQTFHLMMLQVLVLYSYADEMLCDILFTILTLK